jgi:ribosomal protein S18 acetylase RimI-like enzyme
MCYVPFGRMSAHSGLCYTRRMLITQLAPRHAAEAARLHRAGQPGAFLTSLGPEVLTLFYEVLPASSTGFGFVAVQPATGAEGQFSPACEPGGGATCGFVSATTSTGRLFVELGTRRLGRFLPPLLRRFVRQPRLLWLSVQTVFYPILASGHDQGDHAPAAELLSIMVAPALRGRGVGAALLQTLCSTCAGTGIELLDVTVAADNSGARRFYERHGFRHGRDFVIYGREMCGYRLEIEGLGD